MSSCSAESLTALVDGALDHDARDRVHAHLAGCPRCRAEVEAQRALKARLCGLRAAAPDPSGDLVARLRGLAVPGVEPADGRSAPLPVGAAGSRPARPGSGVVRPGDGRPAAGPGARARRSRARTSGTLGGGLLLLGVGLALALGGPPSRGPSTPVDPGSDAFVVDHVSTTGGVPLADPVGRAALLPRP